MRPVGREGVHLEGVARIEDTGGKAAKMQSLCETERKVGLPFAGLLVTEHLVAAVEPERGRSSAPGASQSSEPSTGSLSSAR